MTDVTDEQINALLDEARLCGDAETVFVCLAALVAGDESARAEVARIITSAQAGA